MGSTAVTQPIVELSTIEHELVAAGLVERHQ
jgi:hypothetical protein